MPIFLCLLTKSTKNSTRKKVFLARHLIPVYLLGSGALICSLSFYEANETCFLIPQRTGTYIRSTQQFVSRNILSPPQRLLLVNTRERNGSGSAGERKQVRGERWEEGKGFFFPLPSVPRALLFFPLPSLCALRVYFFPRRDCRRPLRRRERNICSEGLNRLRYSDLHCSEK